MQQTPLIFAFLGFAALLASNDPAHAYGHLAGIQIIDRSTGVTLQVYEHRGRRYIAGEPGHEYQIALTSRQGGRLLAVGSVDGVNIISGATAGFGQDGYVLSSREQLLLAGWRTSLSSTAAFYFTTVPDAYATRTGRPDDLGVIGFALFREKTRCCWPWRREDLQSRRQAPAAEAPATPSMNEADPAQLKDERLGTGYGRSEHSEAVYTEFERASASPDEVLTLYYDSYQNLRRQGVIPGPVRPVPRRPDPFPYRFVPPP